MGQDYSYSQPSSSDDFDITSLLEEEAALYADEADSRYHIADAVHYPTQPEADDGIPTTCYCGGEHVVATSYTRKDPGRRYYTCDNVDDGDCHIWKWWDVAVTEEMSDFQKQLRHLKDQGFECEQKLVKLQKNVSLLSMKKTVVTNGLALELKLAYLRLCVVVRVTHSTCVTMDKNTSYVNLLFSQSQTPVDLDSPEPIWFDSQDPDESVLESVVESGVKERRKWSPKEDKILIGAWLNTSKDAVVSNEQKACAFWKRIVDYYNASPHLARTTPREIGQCKQKWARINEQVSKFVGCYDAALREQRSGQNDDDVMKAALDYFYNDHGYKFTFEHAWRELRRDQKWCSTYVANHGGKDKRKHGVDVDTQEQVGEAEARPMGVKAAKAGTKRKKSGKEEELSQIQAIMEMKAKLSKEKLLERLLAKKEPLTEMETSFKLKLMSEML
ncbi:hypothetical protein N665_2202s0004 [Sinapis alba]|nr:hypothetical protein N665_2202s0004 [Sinapis alba]